MLQQPGIVSGCNDSRGMTMSNLAIDIKHFSYTTTYKSQALNKVTQMPKNTITHQGKLYYSQATTAKLLGITISALKALIIPEAFDWCNFKENGVVWISAQSVKDYRNRRDAKK